MTLRHLVKVQGEGFLETRHIPFTAGIGMLLDIPLLEGLGIIPYLIFGKRKICLTHPVLTNLNTKVPGPKVKGHSRKITVFLFIVLNEVVTAAYRAKRFIEDSFIHSQALKLVRNPALCYFVR